jgi:hypothetical protein
MRGGAVMNLRYFIAWLMAIGFIAIILFSIVELRDAFRIDGDSWFRSAMTFLALQQLHSFSYRLLGKIVVVTETVREG